MTCCSHGCRLAVPLFVRAGSEPWWKSGWRLCLLALVIKRSSDADDGALKLTAGPIAAKLLLLLLLLGSSTGTGACCCGGCTELVSPQQVSAKARMTCLNTCGAGSGPNMRPWPGARARPEAATVRLCMEASPASAQE